MVANERHKADEQMKKLLFVKLLSIDTKHIYFKVDHIGNDVDGDEAKDGPGYYFIPFDAN